MVGEALESRGLSLEVLMMDEHTATPSLEGVDLLIILGSKHSVYDPAIEEAWFGRELEVLADAERRGVPVFGICFGAQALCRYFGGVVGLSEHPEVGWFDVEVVANSGVSAGPWFEYHFDACTLPASAEVWATSPRAVQAFAIGRNVGVQFHPEIDEHQLSDWMKAGGDDDARQLGLDPIELLARTARETSAARARVDALVELVLRHTGVTAAQRTG